MTIEKAEMHHSSLSRKGHVDIDSTAVEEFTKLRNCPAKEQFSARSLELKVVLA